MRSLFVLLFILLLFSCQPPQYADLIIVHGQVATLDTLLPAAEAVAVKDDRIMRVGSNADILMLRNDSTQVIDAKGQFVMPGFIEGHGHFSGLGESLINLNLLHTQSWEEILQLVAGKVKESKPGELDRRARLASGKMDKHTGAERAWLSVSL